MSGGSSTDISLMNSESVRLEILGPLSKGGQNQVYEATLTRLDCMPEPVVTKTPLLEKNPKYLKYLEREYQILSKLKNSVGVL